MRMPPSPLTKSNVRATRPALTLLVNDDRYHFWHRLLEAGYLLRAPINSVPCGLKLKGGRVVARSLRSTLPSPGFPHQARLSLSSSTERSGYSSASSRSGNTFTIGEGRSCASPTVNVRVGWPRQRPPAEGVCATSFMNCGDRHCRLSHHAMEMVEHARMAAMPILVKRCGSHRKKCTSEIARSIERHYKEGHYKDEQSSRLRRSRPNGPHLPKLTRRARALHSALRNCAVSLHFRISAARCAHLASTQRKSGNQHDVQCEL
jgi:hypothetical protein